MRIWARQARIAALWQSEHQRAQTVAAASIPTKSLRTLQLAALPASLHAFAFPWLFLLSLAKNWLSVTPFSDEKNAPAFDVH
jgi:hypothetical protein